jgi:hypothetical protein
MSNVDKRGPGFGGAVLLDLTSCVWGDGPRGQMEAHMRANNVLNATLLHAVVSSATPPPDAGPAPAPPPPPSY